MAKTSEVRFVPTDAIQEAVAGREEQVLDALGVDWRRGRPHIHCPYPDHPDRNPSWRWDAQLQKAFCTCNKGDSIFDIVEKVEGVDFDAAKFRVAELLKREDLIKTKRGNGIRAQHQRIDAISLMSAPADKRDDILPIAYLGYRLNVPLETVPIPVTPTVGLKALEYYDPPPQGSKPKFELVGKFPCAVFGTVGADGKTHAHRIYLAPGGAGKADLGIGPNGYPRDPLTLYLFVKPKPSVPPAARFCTSISLVHRHLANGPCLGSSTKIWASCDHAGNRGVPSH